jgi:hypothetical protein
MMYLLRIGYMRFILTSNRGLQTVMDTLSQAQQVEEDLRHETGGFKLRTERHECSVEALPGYAFAKRNPSRSEVIDPEILPPERSLATRVSVARALAMLGPQIDAKTRRMIEGGKA